MLSCSSSRKSYIIKQMNLIMLSRFQLYSNQLALHIFFFSKTRLHLKLLLLKRLTFGKVNNQLSLLAHLTRKIIFFITRWGIFFLIFPLHSFVTLFFYSLIPWRNLPQTFKTRHRRFDIDSYKTYIDYKSFRQLYSSVPSACDKSRVH